MVWQERLMHLFLGLVIFGYACVRVAHIYQNIKHFCKKKVNSGYD